MFSNVLSNALTVRRKGLVGLLIAIVVVFSSIAFAVGVKAAGSSTPVVFVATGENFPDAFGAGPAAAVNAGPVLLVRRDSIPGPTASELTRLKPDRIVIAGGTAAISAAVETALAAYAPVVDRIGGADRYATAAEISNEFFPAGAVVTGFYTEEQDDIPLPPGQGVTVQVTCDENDPVTGGGYNIDGDSFDVWVEVSRPANDNTWGVEATAKTTAATMSVYPVCADLTP